MLRPRVYCAFSNKFKKLTEKENAKMASDQFKDLLGMPEYSLGRMKYKYLDK